MKEIDGKKFDYFLNVLPPLVWGKARVICFLGKFDGTDTKELLDFDDLFVQGEGWDYHQIYGCKGKKHYLIGNTKKAWNTEDFRYPDSGNDMTTKIEGAL